MFWTNGPCEQTTRLITKDPMIGAYSLLICKFTNDRGLIPFRRLVQLRAGGSDTKTRHVLKSQRVGKTSPVLSFIVNSETCKSLNS